jgi:uncharacterized Zn-binding protein involved in type VI secretion
MSIPAACIGDSTTGHPPGFKPIPIMEGSSDVFVGGKPVACISKITGPVHNFGPVIHPGMLAKGSSTVFANGISICRIGDTLTCSDIIAKGSSEVFVGG